MKKIFLMIALCCLVSGNARAGIDWEAKGMELIGEIVANPAAFFYDFQQDLEATTPLPPGKSFGFQTGLFPTFLPLGYVNGSLKVRLHPEGRWAPGVPQIDLIGGYQNMILAKMAADQSDDMEDAEFYGYYTGLLVTTSVSPKVRTFYGYKRSQLKAKLNFVAGSEPELLGTTVSSFNTGLKDDFLIFGIETLKSANKFWSLQLNYGLKENIITSKVSWYGKWFELGLNIYPEGVLVVHPVWNFHLNF